MLRAFLSHSQRDIEIVRVIVTHLKAAGIEPYVATLAPTPGKEISQKIIQNLQSSDCLVLVLTEAASRSPWVQQEVGLATGLKKRVIPFVEEGVASRGLIAGLEHISFERNRLDDALIQLIDALKQVTLEEQPKYYTTGEAARLLGRSFITLKRWIYEEQISAVRSPSGRILIPREEVERIRGTSLPTTLDTFAVEVIETLKQKKVAYLREMQVCLEDKSEHDATYHKLTELVKANQIKTSQYQNNRWYYPNGSDWTSLSPIADQKIELIDSYTNHPRKYNYKQIGYDDYAEFLVEGALVQAGFTVVARDSYYFNRNIYAPNSGPGRPTDLDFIALSPDHKIFVGIQVKNKLEHPKSAEIVQVVEICNSLHLKPLLVTRTAHPITFLPIKNAGGYTVIFKRYLLQPPFDPGKFASLNALGIPIGIYRLTPEFLIRKFGQVAEMLQSATPAQF